MSAADDILEMKGLCSQIADRLAASSDDKDRVNAVVQALMARVSWNRAFEFLKGRARRIDSWEKDLARARLTELKRIEREREAQRTIAWLASALEGAAASGADVDRSDLAAVQRVLARIGASDSALGDTEPAFTDADETADQSRDWGR